MAHTSEPYGGSIYTTVQHIRHGQLCYLTLNATRLGYRIDTGIGNKLHPIQWSLRFCSTNEWLQTEPNPTVHTCCICLQAYALYNIYRLVCVWFVTLCWVEQTTPTPMYKITKRTSFPWLGGILGWGMPSSPATARLDIERDVGRRRLFHHLLELLQCITVGAPVQLLHCSEPTVDKAARMTGNLHHVFDARMSAGHHAPHEVAYHILVFVLPWNIPRHCGEIIDNRRTRLAKEKQYRCGFIAPECLFSSTMTC